MKSSVLSSAPSNIALIKYMGKQLSQTGVITNTPTNPSLSYTLESLRTYVSLQSIQDEKSDRWNRMAKEEVSIPGSSYFSSLELSEKSIQKFLKHLTYLKSEFQIEEVFEVRSANTFPSDAGLASSASSFAALTKCFFEWMQAQAPHKIEQKAKHLGGDVTLVDWMSSLSRLGSGSSCRSFYTPWSVWDETGAHGFQSLYQKLDHLALVVSAEKKEVSSSQAHVMVLESPHFQGRVERAKNRMTRLCDLLQNSDLESWRESYQICWDEFHDMHDLFHTCPKPFRYMTSLSDQALTHIEKMWVATGDGPLVTMDAGPNIHFLFRPDQTHLKKMYVKDLSRYGQLIDSTSVAHGMGLS